MTIFPSLLALALTTLTPHAQKDDPITAKTSTISVTTNSQSAPGCSFNAQSMMYSVEQTLNIGSQSSGAGAGRVSFQPVTLVKPVDICSAGLFYDAAAGIAFKEVIVIVSPPSNAPAQPTFLIRLGTAAISSLSEAASDGTVIQEKVQFEYGDLTMAEVQNGALKSCKGWDRVRNVQDSSHCNELAGLAPK